MNQGEGAERQRRKEEEEEERRRDTASCGVCGDILGAMTVCGSTTTERP